MGVPWFSGRSLEDASGPRSIPSPDEFDDPAAFDARVAHGQWGEGVIQRYDTVVVLFDEVGYKTLDVLGERELLEEA
jgi:hypothetical protein